jgi:hypothetical protein
MLSMLEAVSSIPSTGKRMRQRRQRRPGGGGGEEEEEAETR